MYHPLFLPSEYATFKAPSPVLVGFRKCKILHSTLFSANHNKNVSKPYGMGIRGVFALCYKLGAEK